MKIKFGVSIVLASTIIQSSAFAAPRCDNDDRCETGAINLYVGPETVEPQQDIYVMVELETTSGNSVLDGKLVSLTYKQNGKFFIRTGNVKNGIAEFKINAGTRAGQINFTASYKDHSSDTKKALVSSGEVKPFDLRIRSGLLASSLEIETDVVTDIHANRVEDGTLVKLITRTDDRVQKIQSAYIANGRTSFTWSCPPNKKSSIVEVNIKQSWSRMTIPAAACYAGDLD